MRDSNVSAFPDVSVQWERLLFCLWWLGLYLQDQYINHIINETGATVLLRGRGSGHLGGSQGEGSVFLPALALLRAAKIILFC